MSLKQTAVTVLKSFLGENLLSELRKYHFARSYVRGNYRDFEKETKILGSLVTSGDIALDIGANIGIYSWLLSELVGETGLVVAFEPVPVTYGYLSYNIRTKGLKNVVTCNVALSNESKVLEMIVPDVGLNDIYTSHIKTSDSSEGKIWRALSQTIDDLCGVAFDKIDFIKCDVEGAELLVFKGGEKTILKHMPVILCEIGGGCRSFGYEPEHLFQWFSQYDYMSYYFDGIRLVPCHGINSGNANSNYFFVPSSKFNKINSLIC